MRWRWAAPATSPQAKWQELPSTTKLGITILPRRVWVLHINSANQHHCVHYHFRHQANRSSTIIVGVSLFGYAIYPSADAQKECVS